VSHPQQRAWCHGVQQRFPWAFSDCNPDFTTRFVLDVGSLDINGNNREHFAPDTVIIGCDVAPGKNVDIVLPAHMLTFRAGFFQTIISTECLEHDMHWQATLANCCRMLASGGLLVITCAGPGRPEHGTTRTSPADAPGLPWPDYYRNLSVDDLRGVLTPDLFSERLFDCCLEPADTYFAGVKK
jgi:SAM-dependent methyltransferase